SQAIGPCGTLCEVLEWTDLPRFGAPGPQVTLPGSVMDGDGNPVTAAPVELWQSDPPADDHFPAFGRSRTDEAGRFHFKTLKPGPVPGRGNAQQAPHFALTILARGLLKGLVTRAYFAGEPLNETDPMLSAIEDPARRATLIAASDGLDRWRID